MCGPEQAICSSWTPPGVSRSRQVTHEAGHLVRSHQELEIWQRPRVVGLDLQEPGLIDADSQPNRRRSSTAWTAADPGAELRTFGVSEASQTGTTGTAGVSEA